MTYDCFTFFNELDLLEIRMNILRDVVDRFVICEATVTHQGKPKPLYLAENWERFREFHGKMIYVRGDDPPAWDESLRNSYGDNWQIENWQRSQLKRGLANCTDDDVIIVSDLDEIPRPEAIRAHLRDGGITCFEVEQYAFYLNFRASFGPFRKTMMAPFAYYRDVLPKTEMPNARAYCILPQYRIGSDPNKLLGMVPDRIVRHGGWHFSYLGGMDSVIEKRQAQPEQQHNTSETTSREWIKKRVYDGYDTLNGQNVYYPTFCPWRLPRYVRQNKIRYCHLFYHAPLLHKSRLQMRFLAFLFLSFGAAVVRRVFGHVRVIQSVKRMVVR